MFITDYMELLVIVGCSMFGCGVGYSSTLVAIWMFIPDAGVVLKMQLYVCVFRFGASWPLPTSILLNLFCLLISGVGIEMVTKRCGCGLEE